MYNKDGLVEKFKKAGLVLKFGTVMGSNKDVFGMRVERAIHGNARSEMFVMQCGHEDNTIQVMDMNSEFGQVVLLVKEEARRFFTEHKDYKTKKMIKTWHTTPKSTRKFLAGRDERQLFMCQVKATATTVAQAHQLLKNPTVHTAEGKLGRAARQGEWFFLPCSDAEIQEIERHIKKSEVAIRKKVRLPSPGKPHTAEEYLAMASPKLSHGFSVQLRDNIFVRGKITHADHETVTFSRWRRVLRNMEEGRDGDRGGRMGTWID
jgi:hypothetical protein